ncbi:MAG: hypothetical protein VX640_04035 [Pseudomonadota bacterium]|nr:hypothetical protein [Pseudomonadota bacterium]
MPSASKALIRDCVVYANGRGPAVAPVGEYDITRLSDCEIGFCNCATRHAFSMSVDAMQQHLCEGRMRLLGGDRLPSVAAKK